jgi:NADH dehydrogenase
LVPCGVVFFYGVFLNMAQILVLGGTGFVGRHLCEQLQRGGHRVTVATRRTPRMAAAYIQHQPLVTVLQADVSDPAALASVMQGHDAVVNLVAILHGKEADFERVHVTFAQTVVQACQAAGVRRLVHISALGAGTEAPSHYQRSKARGEAVVHASGLDVTVLRPSVMFGADDQFLNLFATLQAWLPWLPVAGGDTRFQPVWVEDVARAIVHALEHRSTIGQTVEAVGPEVFTLTELARMAGQAAGRDRWVWTLPTGLAYFQAVVMEWMPGVPLLSTDNIASLEVDNVASGQQPTLSDWGCTPASVSGILPTYLNRQLRGVGGGRSYLSVLRDRASS